MGSSQHPVHVEGLPGSLHQRVVWHGLERNSDGCMDCSATSMQVPVLATFHGPGQDARNSLIACLKACLISLLGCWGPDPATLWSRSREFCKAAVAVSVGQSEPESVRTHREVLLAGILHMYWCGRSEHTTRCHRQDMAIFRGLEAPVVVS